MQTQEEFENSGSWLYRLGSYFPLPLIGIFLMALGEFHDLKNGETLDYVWEEFCLCASSLE